MVLVGELQTRAQELDQFGSADSHFLGFAAALFFVIFGMFVAHTGIVYYWRRGWHSSKGKKRSSR